MKVFCYDQLFGMSSCEHEFLVRKLCILKCDVSHFVSYAKLKKFSVISIVSEMLPEFFFFVLFFRLYFYSIFSIDEKCLILKFNETEGTTNVFKTIVYFFTFYFNTTNK